MLHMLGADVLDRVLFPVGDLDKTASTGPRPSASACAPPTSPTARTSASSPPPRAAKRFSATGSPAPADRRHRRHRGRHRTGGRARHHRPAQGTRPRRRGRPAHVVAVDPAAPTTSRWSPSALGRPAHRPPAPHRPAVVRRPGAWPRRRPVLGPRPRPRRHPHERRRGRRGRAALGRAPAAGRPGQSVVLYAGDVVVAGATAAPESARSRSSSRNGRWCLAFLLEVPDQATGRRRSSAVSSTSAAASA